jgi:predicted secreted protein
MAFVKGSVTLFTADGTEIGGKRQVTINLNITTDDSTVMGDSWTSAAAILNGWDATVNGLMVVSDAGQAALIAAATTGTAITAVVSNGSISRSGSALVTKISESYAHDKLATYDVTLQGVGTLTLA